MTKSFRVSRGVLVTLLVSAVLTGATWFVYLKRRPVLATPMPALAKLLDEFERLREFTDETRDLWRRRRDGLQEPAWTRRSMAALESETGAGWSWQWSAADRAVVRRVGPKMAEWSSYISMIELFTRKPGLVVEAAELRAAGAGQSRGFTTVRFGIRFHVIATNNGEDAESGSQPSQARTASTLDPWKSQAVGAAAPLDKSPPSFRSVPPRFPTGMLTETINNQDPK